MRDRFVVITRRRRRSDGKSRKTSGRDSSLTAPGNEKAKERTRWTDGRTEGRHETKKEEKGAWPFAEEDGKRSRRKSKRWKRMRRRDSTKARRHEGFTGHRRHNRARQSGIQAATAAEVSPLLIITAWRASERLSSIHHRDEWPRCQ